MLSPHDELLCHQLPTTFDHVSQSDLRWTERIVMYGSTGRRRQRDDRDGALPTATSPTPTRW
jgi:hypothetical protein